MAVVVQSQGGQSTGQVVNLIKTMTVTAGNTIIAMVQSDGHKATGTANVSDGVNSYVKIVELDGEVAIYRALNVAGGVTIVIFTPDAGIDYCALSIAEVSGLAGSPDDGSTSNTAASTGITTGSVTTTESGIVFGVFSRHAASTIVIADSHTDIFDTGNTYASVNGAAGYFISAAGANALLWTGGAANTYKACIAAFKDPSSSLFPPFKNRIQAV